MGSKLSKSGPCEGREKKEMKQRGRQSGLAVPVPAGTPELAPPASVPTPGQNGQAGPLAQPLSGRAESKLKDRTSGAGLTMAGNSSSLERELWKNISVSTAADFYRSSSRYRMFVKIEFITIWPRRSNRVRIYPPFWKNTNRINRKIYKMMVCVQGAGAQAMNSC